MDKQTIEFTHSQLMAQRLNGAYQPPRKVSISEWAIENRILPKGTSRGPAPSVQNNFKSK